MRTALVTSMALLLFSVACSSADDSKSASGSQDITAGGDAAPTPSASATTTPPASSATPCTDIAGTYQPVDSKVASGTCAVPDDSSKTPFVISKGDNGQWKLVDGDTTAQGALDTTTCTLHLQENDGNGAAKASLTADYHFTATGYSAALALTVSGAGTDDCDGKFTETGTKN